MSSSRGGNGAPERASKAPPARAGELARDALARAARLARGRGVEIATVIVVVGGGLLVLSDFLDLFRIKAGAVVVDNQSGGSNHAYALAVIGATTIAAALLARASEQRPPAFGVLALAVAALAVTLLVDLPDCTKRDLLPGARLGKASPAIGLWVELAGGLVAAVGGTALVVLLGRRR